MIYVTLEKSQARSKSLEKEIEMLDQALLNAVDTDARGEGGMGAADGLRSPWTPRREEQGRLGGVRSQRSAVTLTPEALDEQVEAAPPLVEEW